MWRNSAAEICMAIGISHADRRVTINNYWDGVTAGGQNTGIGLVGNTARAFRLELPSTANNQVGRARAATWATTSSRRWKTNIKTIDKGTDVVMRLHPTEFDWKPERGGMHDTSFIAEELIDVIPHAVALEDDGTPGSIDSVRVIPYLVAAVQERQRLIADLKIQLQRLHNSNSAP